MVAHEIAHSALRHHAALQRTLPSNPFAPLAFVSPGWVAAYQRDQERAADRVGQGIAAAAGYDPAGLERFLRGLGQVERLIGGGGRVPTFFDTHPPTTERAAGAAADVVRVARASRAAAPRRPRRTSSGSTASSSARTRRKGYFEGTRFVHPDLDFAIRFPTGWSTVNTPASVGAVAPDGSTARRPRARGKGGRPEARRRRLRGSRSAELRATIDEVRSVELNGLRAYELRGEAGGLRGRLLFVAHRGSVSRITTASAGFGSKRALPLALIAARSFRPLTPEERAAVTVERLRLRRARAGETLDEAVARRTGSAWDANELALANALPAREPLDGGRLLKVARIEPYRGAAPPAPAAGGAPR